MVKRKTCIEKGRKVKTETRHNTAARVQKPFTLGRTRSGKAKGEQRHGKRVT